MDVEEEGQSRREAVDLESSIERGLHIGDSIGQRKADLLRCVASGLPDVVAADADRIPPGHMLCAEFKNIADEPQRRSRWVDMSAASDIFLENVVLNGSTKLVWSYTLAFCDYGVKPKEG